MERNAQSPNSLAQAAALIVGTVGRHASRHSFGIRLSSQKLRGRRWQVMVLLHRALARCRVAAPPVPRSAHLVDAGQARGSRARR